MPKTVGGTLTLLTLVAMFIALAVLITLSMAGLR